MGARWAAVLDSGRQSVTVFRAVLRDFRLVRVELAFVGFNVAEYGTWIAMLVYAYQAAGVTGAGIVSAAQLVPAALFAPLASVMGDRHRRDRVLAAGYLLQVTTAALTGLVLLVHPPLVIATIAAATSATSATVTRPVQGALLPQIARTVQELTAANVVSGWVESASIVVGPLLTGVLLGFVAPGGIFLVMAGILWVSTLLTLRLNVSPRSQDDESIGVSDELMEGLRVVLEEPRARTVVSFLAANSILVGALDILTVVLAIHILHAGSPGVGFLTAAWGLGGLMAAALMSGLITRRSQMLSLRSGTACWGAGLTGLALVSVPGSAAILMGLVGAGRPLLDVSGRTLLQRVVEGHTLARALGFLEGVGMAAEGAGMILTPLLFAVAGDRYAFVVAGLLIPVLLLVLRRPLQASDRYQPVPAGYVATVRAVPFFAPLAAPVIERLALALIPLVDMAPGTVVIREGDIGDRFYIIASGKVDVSIAGNTVRTLGPGASFGEIALLRDIPRTATITAVETLTLFALERDDFLEAVTGHPQTRRAAESVADSYLRPAPQST